MLPNLLEKFVASNEAYDRRVTLAYAGEVRIANPSNSLTILYEIDVQPFLNTINSVFQGIFNNPTAYTKLDDLNAMLSELLIRSTFQIDIRDDKNKQTITIQNPFSFEIVANTGTLAATEPYRIFVKPNPIPQKFDLYFISSEEIYITIKYPAAELFPIGGSGSGVFGYQMGQTFIYTDVNQFFKTSVKNPLNPNGILSNYDGLPSFENVNMDVLITSPNATQYIYAPQLVQNLNQDFLGIPTINNADNTLNYPLDANLEGINNGYLQSSSTQGLPLEQFFPKLNIAYVQFNKQVTFDLLHRRIWPELYKNKNGE